MSMCGKNHYNIVISLQLKKKKKKKNRSLGEPEDKRKVKNKDSRGKFILTPTATVNTIHSLLARLTSNFTLKAYLSQFLLCSM